MTPPTFADIVAAREFVGQYLPKTPLVAMTKISQLFGFDYYAKCENLQPVGAFKVRGGVNLVGTASDKEKNAGMVSASTGNHGLSIAYAGKLFGVRVIIYAPAENVNQEKMQAIRDVGAEVRLHGRDFDEAREEAESAARAEGYRYVHSANEPKLIAGVGAIGLEIFDDLPEVDFIIAPVGGGSCASGNCIVARQLNKNVRVIGVQSEQAPAVWQAWKDRTLKPHPRMETQHEGLATRVPFELTNKILWELLDDFVLVSDEEINEAIRLLAQHGKQVAEGAGAASLAAAIKVRDRLQGKKVVGVLTGGNIPTDRFVATLSA
ncbi:MAG TPA: pyridoxal-phosphate dependent enzyme [Pyrinomonadaceae bacterium]|nr:pyridoxal-phosphate dependent enzyme [Pyrinomonadaceae bacterium]